jgi:shikimate dehydrogenase
MADPDRAFVTGYPIKHSRSPLIHRHWLHLSGQSGSYDAVEMTPDDFPEFIEKLASGRSGFVGGNVTIPHKEAAFALSQKPDDIAAELGAANTLWLEDGQLLATNTDGYGFAANLDAMAPGWSDWQSAVVLGAGGASRAIILTLRDRGFRQIRVVNRTVARAQALADRFGKQISAHPLEALPEVMRGAGFFVNTSALGMEGSNVPTIDFSPLNEGAVVTDIVYAPLITPILSMAAAQGFKTVDGLGMLLHQAVPGFEKWFGIRPVVTEQLRSLIIADLEQST